MHGRTLADIRMGSVLNWNVIGVRRERGTLAAPGPDTQIFGGDRLVVEGRAESLRALESWRRLTLEESGTDLEKDCLNEIALAEATLPIHSSLVGKNPERRRFPLPVRHRCSGHSPRCRHQKDQASGTGPWRPVTSSCCQGPANGWKAAAGGRSSRISQPFHGKRFSTVNGLRERIMVMGVPADSGLSGQTLMESRLGDAMGSRVLGILRAEAPILLPEPQERVMAGDRLIVEGNRTDFLGLDAFEELEIESEPLTDIASLATDGSDIVEAVLSPHTSLFGKTLRQLNFREKYGITVLAIWRGGKPLRSDIRDIVLQFGDALLLFGPRAKLRLLGQDSDVIVLTAFAQEEPRLEMAKISTLLMAMVLLPVILGWIPIYISAVVGAALMVLTGCLTVDEAYRQIEWKAVCLIAGLLPLGTALDRSGAARMIAEGVVSLVGPHGPVAVMAGIVALTFMATCFVPTAALVVLMAPIVLNTSADMGISPHATDDGRGHGLLGQFHHAPFPTRPTSSSWVPAVTGLWITSKSADC